MKLKHDKHVNIRDIAKEAGVSPSTVSRVLNGRSSNVPIAEKTKQRVEAVAKLLGYQPNIHAKRLFSKKSNVIGMLVPPMDKTVGDGFGFPEHVDTCVTEAQNGILDVLRRRGYHLMINVADEKFIQDKVYLDLFRSRSVDGLLIWGICLADEYTRELLETQRAFVLMNSHQQAQSNSCIVDNCDASAKLARHLLDLGHKRIAYIKGWDTSTVGIERFTGFQGVMEQAGLFDDTLVFQGDYSVESGRIACREILRHNSDITAIACANDCMAIGVIDALEQAGVDVPGDISVTGADASFPYYRPSLTSFKPPYYDIGMQSAQWLVDYLDTENNKDKSLELKKVFSPRMVYGNTTAKPRG